MNLSVFSTKLQPTKILVSLQNYAKGDVNNMVIGVYVPERFSLRIGTDKYGINIECVIIRKQSHNLLIYARDIKNTFKFL